MMRIEKEVLFKFLIPLVFFLNGCAPLLIAGAGVVTGYMLSNDATLGTVHTSYRSLWDVSMDVLDKEKAYIIMAKESDGIIKAKIMDYRIVISIDTVDKEEQKLKVSTRKYLIPQPQFSQKIFFKITKELE